MYRNDEMMKKLDEFLLDVQKPSRYIGGESGSVCELCGGTSRGVR